MKFSYKAKKGPDKIVKGIVEAENTESAVAKISQMGLVPVSVQEGTGHSEEIHEAPGRQEPGSFFKKGASKKDVYIFTKKLRVLLRSHEPILRSLYFLEEQTPNRELKEILRSIIGLVREGLSFSESLARFPRHFPPLYISIIKAGEASGNLDHALDQITGYLDKERQLSQKVTASLAYPAVMVTVGFATVVFILTFVIPKLKTLFEDFADKLPLVTKVLLDVSMFFSRYWIMLLIFTAVFIAYLYYTRSAPWQRRILTAVKKRTPVISNIIYNQALCRFASGLSILLSAGVSILDSIKIATPLIDDDDAKKGLDNACDQIVAGTPLEESLRNNCRFLPDMFIRMVAVGEASGRLDEILTELGENYADEVETATTIVTSLVEPVAILIVGGILGVIVIAILLPIFEMSLFIQ